MYNYQRYAIRMESILKVPSGSANDIANNPLDFVKGFLDKIYDISEEKAELINEFDDKYEKYRDIHLRDWDENDTEQMVKELREIIRG